MQRSAVTQKFLSRRRLAVFIGVMSFHFSICAAAQVDVNGKHFTVPDGFAIEVVAVPPIVQRPIEADFDDLGNLYVSDSSGSNDDPHDQLKTKPHRVLRLSSSHADGRFDQQTIFADGLTFPEGVCWLNDSLYVAGVPSIWKLTDSRGISGPGIADQRVEWFSGKTITHCANDLHGPYAGPDGWIYWCKGAFAEQTYEHAGLPSRSAGGERTPLVTRASHIFRARPDGTGIEPVMTGGMDNPIEVAFTAGGERLFTTTFLQEPSNGRRDGVIHAIYGGVYGKQHDVLDNQPRTSPELMPVLSHLGPAACCGLMRYESDAFGPAYRDNFFVTCFNLHKVTRLELAPAGATFTSRDSDFLTCDSLDFHPTDVLEDADGSLLVIDTGGWYKLCCPTSQLGKPDLLGAIYRVRRADARAPADPRGLKLAWSSMSADDLAKLLDDPRPAVRKRAIAQLAQKGVSAAALLSVLLQSKTSSPLARLGAVWTCARIDDPAARNAVRTGLRDSDEIVRQAAAHCASLWRDRLAEPMLLELLASGTPQNQRVAAEALGGVGESHAVPQIFLAIAKADRADHILNHSLTYALMEIDDSAATSAGLNDPSPAVRRSALFALDQMINGKLSADAVAAALDASDEPLRASAAWIAGRHTEWADSFIGVMKWQLSLPASEARLIQEAAALSQSQAVQKWLAATVLGANSTRAARQIALTAIAQSRLKETPPAWINAVIGALKRDDVGTLSSAVAAAAAFPKTKRPIAELDSALLVIGTRADFPPELRLKAMSAIAGRLPQMDAGLFSFLRSQLAAGTPLTRQISAADVIGRSVLTANQLDAISDDIATAGPLLLDPLLAAYNQTHDPAIGRKLIATLKRTKAAGSLRGEALRKRLAGFGPEVQAEAGELYTRLNPDAGKMKAHLDELEKALRPGDVRRGQLVFNGTRASCFACHAIGYVGGDVGPDLTRIGQTRAPRDLLESIVYPSASFVQSFEPVQITTTAGDTQYGIPRGGSADEVVLVTGPNQRVRIPRDQIKDMRPGSLSVMPAGFDQTLSPQELADVIAFLRACK